MTATPGTLKVKGQPLTPPKHILIDGHKIRFRFLQSLLWVIPATSLAVAMWAAVYYLGTQKGIFFPKSSWDNLIHASWWPNYRHGLRDFGEPVAAALAIHSFIVASWRKYGEALHGMALARRVAATITLAFGIILLGVYVIDYALKDQLAHVTAVASTGSAGNVLSGLNWEAFAFSFIAVHLIRKVWEPVGNAISLALTETAVRRANGRLPLWVRKPLAPPAMRERFVWVQETTPFRDMKRGPLARLLITLGALAVLALAGYGEYVLHVVAKGH